MLAFSSKAAKHPSIGGLIATELRSLGRAEKRRVAGALLANLRMAEVKTLAGLYLGNAGVYNVELDRMCRVTTRIMQGLFYHHFRHRIPTSHLAVSLCVEGFSVEDKGAVEELRRFAAKAVSAREVRSVGQGVFTYAYSECRDAQYASVWIMEFFQAVDFIGFVIPKNDSDIQC